MQRVIRAGWPLALGALALAFASPARADADAPRIAAHLALGFGGDADANVGDASSSASLDPTVGFGFRVEAPVHDLVVLGGSFELLTFEWDGAGAEREEVFDFDGYVRGRYPIELREARVTLEPYVMLPVGFAMAVLPDGDGDRVWPGWNIGVLAGLTVLLEDAPVGFFFELGWRHHQVYTEQETILGDFDAKIVTNQLAMQLGAAFVLE